MVKRTAVAILIGLVTAACGSGDEKPADHLAQLAEPQQKADRLPDQVDPDDSIDRSTTRSVGGTADTKHWAAVSDDAKSA